MASVSHRISVRRPPSPPSEPTSTLVLCTPNGFQVDIRLTLSPRTLSWAFAALCSATPLPATHPLPTHDSNATWKLEDLKPGRHAVWKHVLDSRERESDEGDIFTLSDGTELEVGSGSTGVYEEVWCDEKLEPQTRSVALRAFWDEDRGDEGEEWRGLAVWVGGYMQVIYRHALVVDMRVERFSLGSTEGKSKWEVEFESGGNGHVTKWLREVLSERDGTWTLGKEVQVEGVRWRVVDVNE